MSASPSGADAEYIAIPSGIMFEMGWSRFLPPMSVGVFTAVSFYGEPTEAQIERFVDFGDTNLGRDIPVWDEPRIWTEEELRLLDEEYPPGPGDAQTLAEINAEEEEEQIAAIAMIDGYAAGLGLPPIRTLADVVGFMRACRLLLTVIAEDGETRYRLNLDPPFPGDVLILPPEVLEREDRIRLIEMYEPVVQQIISLFTSPEARQPDSKRTSLQRLARELDLDVDTTRAGLSVLIGDKDFTTTRDPETVEVHQVFEIRIDWELFNTNRISISFAAPDM